MWAPMGIQREISQWKHKSLLSCRRSVNLFWCLHLLISSDFLFNELSPLYEAISSFSLRHRSHFVLVVSRTSLVVLKGAHFLVILQVTFGLKWLRFIVQYSLEFCVVLIVFNVEWFCVVAKPVFKICFSGSSVNFLLIAELVRRDLCFGNDVWGFKYFPFRGQLFLFLQLQLS